MLKQAGVRLDNRNIEQYFNQQAEHWDDHSNKDTRKMKDILDICDLHSGQKVLDVGCGTGVLLDDFGAPLRPIRLSNNFKRLLDDNDLPHIRFHDLRHIVATYMLSMGVPIAEISAWLRHMSVSTTANIYAHITDDMRKSAAKWMDAGYDPDGGAMLWTQQ